MKHSNRIARRIGAAWFALAAGLAGAGALAADCDVNVFEAYQKAVSRGWTFSCDAAGVGVTSNFVTYPPQNIGCVIKTPPVRSSKGLGRVKFFRQSTGNAPSLHNGWSVKTYEVQGVQWSKIPASNYGGDSKIRLDFHANGDKPNWTYNARLSRLTLSKSGGSCAKAIDEAF